MPRQEYHLQSVVITWQWAPDCRPARQAGQLLGLTRLGSIFSLTEFFGSRTSS